jgi:hypothetical protein
MMEDEDDLPPLLVDANGEATSPDHAASLDGRSARVPITIITGEWNRAIVAAST